MELIEISMDALLTTTGVYLTSFCDLDEDSLTTAVASTATTATANPIKVVIVEDTMAYVESLSDEDLENLYNMLEEKEISFESAQSVPENPKTYFK